MRGVQLHHGDCLDVLRTLPDNSVHAVVTDPPYNLSFMAKQWDTHASARAFQDWCELWAIECLRVLKPGGHLLAFGGTRTFHRLAVAVEDAGFEIRDSIAWLYGSGFPKSLRVNSDPRFCQCASRSAAVARSGVGTVPAPDAADRTSTGQPAASRTADAPAPSARHATGSLPGSPVDCQPGRDSGGAPLPLDVARDLASAPQPLGALGRSRSSAPDDDPEGRAPSRSRSLSDTGRPSMPGSGPPSAQTESGHGTGVNRTLGRRGTGSASESQAADSGSRDASHAMALPQCNRCGKPNADGFGTSMKPAFEPIVVARKPLAGTVAANVQVWGTGALNIDATRVSGNVDEMRGRSGTAATPGGDTSSYRAHNADGGVWEPQPAGRWPANVALDGDMADALDEQSGPLHTQDPATRKSRSKVTGATAFSTGASIEYDDRSGPSGASRFFPTFRYQAKAPTRERPKVDGVAHATVKPLELMRWLVRLVTPPGGVVLEPFAGSGTTVEACILEGFACIAIERDADYLPLIQARIDRHDGTLDLGVTA